MEQQYGAFCTPDLHVGALAESAQLSRLFHRAQLAKITHKPLLYRNDDNSNLDKAPGHIFLINESSWLSKYDSISRYISPISWF